MKIIKQGRLGQIYNIASNTELTNISIVKDICKILDQIKPRKNKKKRPKLKN